MPCTASNRTSCASRLSKGLEHAKTTREMNVDRSPTRSGLGSATRTCRRKSPPGSEAVRGVEARAHHACKQHHPVSAETSPDRFHGPARTRAHESTESMLKRGWRDAARPHVALGTASSSWQRRRSKRTVDSIDALGRSRKALLEKAERFS
jgi:predicted nucleic acid-binding Zn ribbon protein